ncbi:hypothetical protein CDIOL_36180 [Clostridium diolis]|uniref:Uncharacterized protein n=1 Tax=Clostridium diolis TaxID=223919 RepID=A0AAV3W2M8_9CLOT|nr:hypothetical protein CDIOL_36180 [Clostridium diolis]
MDYSQGNSKIYYLDIVVNFNILLKSNGTHKKKFLRIFSFNFDYKQ